MKLGIRQQLWGLFGLFLLTGATVLVIDEVSQYRARQSLQSMRDHSLQRMHLLKAVADHYSQGVVDTTFKARNHLITWNQGVAIVDRARRDIDASWRVLEPMPRTPAQRALFEEARHARVRADAAAARLRTILLRQDIKAIGEFADTELYPAIDPVTSRLQRLSDLAMVQAENVVRDDIERGRRASMLRIGLSLVVLLVVALIGRAVLRNAYRGVESLTFLARRMRKHDYTAMPRYLPRTGELAMVTDAFLEMRRDVLGFETELTQQLARNERIREELVHREQFMQSLLDAAQVSIIAFDTEGRITTVNTFFERLLGWRKDEIVGKRFPRFDEPDVGPDIAPHLRSPAVLAAVAQQISVLTGRTYPPDYRAAIALAELAPEPVEGLLLHRDGHEIPVLGSVAPVRDGNGEIIGVIGSSADLAGIKKLEAELRASEARAQDANRAKSSFLAAMSHEIRTPMIGVTGMIEILAHSKLDNDQRHALNVIQQSSQSLLQIIGDILDFSKIEAGRMEISPTTVDLGAVLRSTVANYTGAASSKGLTLTCEIDGRVAPAYRADALRLRQIIGNFLSNAIKFTAKGGVEVALEWRGAADPPSQADDGGLGADVLSFRITDTGIGVSAQAQQRLFQPFAQAEGDTTRRYGGTGLGLAICTRLAELMGGQVTMDSVPQVGTTMRLAITLPRAPVSELPADTITAGNSIAFTPRRLPTLQQAERERSLVLLVDDHPTNRMVIARQLALAGYASEAAEDGVEGLERWRSGRYALVLSDIHMPRMDGYAMAGKIREDEQQRALPRTPVIALTASALKGEAERCLGAGMDDYLAKPVAVATLAATLQRWLPHTVATGDTADAEANGAVNAGAALASGGFPQLDDAPALLDYTALHELSGGDESDTAALLRDFLDATAQDLAQLAREREAGDIAAITRQAHKIKGAARLVGASELATAAADLEAAGHTGEWAGILPLLPGVETAAERLKLFVAERYREA